MGSRSVYVGGLHPSTNEGQFKKFLLKFGKVESFDLAKDKGTGCSKGFGFAIFKEQEAADLAVSKSGELELNGNIGCYQLNHLVMTEGNSKLCYEYTNRKVYIGRLDVSTTEHTLRQFLLDFGEVENVVIITDRETGDSRGFGFATFKDQAAADLACCKSGQEIDGNQVIINYARDRGDRGGGRGGYNRDRGYNRGYDRGGYGRDYEDRGGYGGRRQY